MTVSQEVIQQNSVHALPIPMSDIFQCTCNSHCGVSLQFSWDDDTCAACPGNPRIVCKPLSMRLFTRARQWVLLSTSWIPNMSRSHKNVFTFQGFQPDFYMKVSSNFPYAGYAPYPSQRSSFKHQKNIWRKIQDDSTLCHPYVASLSWPKYSPQYFILKYPLCLFVP